MKVSLEKKIFIGFLMNITVILVFGWISYRRIQNQKDKNELLNHQQKINTYTAEISSVIDRINNNAKTYVITGSEEYLDASDETIYSIWRDIEHLKNLLGDGKKVEELKKLVNEKIGYVNQLTELRKYRDFETAKGIISIEKNAQITKRISQNLAGIQSEEDSLFKRRIEHIDFLERNLSIAFIVLLFCTLVLLFVIYFIITKQLKEKKAAETLLQENRQLLQSIIDNTTNPIFIKRINGQYLLINKQFERLFHYTNEQLKAKTDHDIFPKTIADSLREADLDVVKADKEIKQEEKFPQADGLHTYLVAKFPLRDLEGKIYAVGGIATDITEQKKQDTLQRESEGLVQAIFNAAPDAVIVINEEGNIIKWNPKSEELFGWKAEEVLGKPMHTLIMPLKYRERHLKGLQHFLQTGEGPILHRTVEVTALKKSKLEFDIELSISPSSVKDKNIFIAFVRDITRRKIMETELSQAKNFLDSIIENMPSMIFVKDVDGLRFMRINRAGEKLLGYSHEEVVGKSDYDLFPREQADFFTRTDRDAIKKEELLDIEEEPIDTKNGRRWLHTKKMLIKDEKGKPLYLLGISEDITEKKHLGEEHDEADKLLRESDERMKLIMANIGEGVIVSDTQQKILMSNRMAEEILGIKEKPHASIDWSEKYDIFYPDRLTTFPAQNLPLEKALRNELTDDEEIFIRNQHTGEEKRIRVTGRPIKDEKNNIIAAVATIRDITKHKEMKDAMNVSDRKYRKLIGFKRSSKRDIPPGEEKN